MEAGSDVAELHAHLSATPRLGFLLGTTVPTQTRRPVAGQLELIPAKPNDLPRLIRSESPQTSLVVIGDPRNDENLIVAQMHVAFLKFHNKVVDKLESGDIPRDESKSLFEQAREIVLWHYQWIVLHDFLRRILDTNQLDEVLTNGRQFYDFQDEPFIPVEFSVAAYRLGHSMVRSVYAYNRVFTLPTINTDSKFDNATLDLLFEFTAKSGNPSSPAGLMPTLPSNWIIDWRGFFEIDGREKVGFSRKLDPYLAKPLTNLPNVPMPNSLAIRNLLRGQSLGLPSGQDVAKHMGFEPLDPSAIADSGSDGIVAAELGS
ncbi:MAG: hypothetical protein HC866_23865 [Leptolyngbyaceae cyanobacterium RU_5_1]|nr:hypothetical protein [Leptolyngbyaceae cyanobacterium RU_5_1]